MNAIKRNRWTGLAAALGLGLTLGIGTPAISLARTVTEAPDAQGSADPTAGLEAVNSIPVLAGAWSWQPLDDGTVVLWATPAQPYLVRLRFPSYDLKWANVIGVTSFGSRIYARFDSVRVRGFPYPIDSIYKLSRDEARTLTRGDAETQPREAE